MILFFQSPTKTVLAVEAAHAFSPEDVQKLVWLFSEAAPLQSETLDGWYVGPRREMITPWSTNADVYKRQIFIRIVCNKLDDNE